MDFPGLPISKCYVFEGSIVLDSLFPTGNS